MIFSSGMTFFLSIAVICDVKMKRLIGIFLLVYFCYQLTSVCIKLISIFIALTSICIERTCIGMTLYQKECKPLKFVPDCIAHIRDVMHCRIDTTWRMDDVKKLFMYQSNGSFNIPWAYPGHLMLFLPGREGI